MNSTRNHSYRNDPGYPRPLPEFLREADAELLAFKRNPRWGGWTLDPRWLLLRNDELPWYQIELQTCRSPEDVLDWLVQVRDRYSPEQLGHLVLALNDLLGFREHLFASRQLDSADIPDVRAHLEREGWLVSTRRTAAKAHPIVADEQPGGVR